MNGSTPTSGAPARSPSLAIPLAVGGALGVVTTQLPVGDTDLFWHLATARETLERGIVGADLFSWTIPGQPIPTDQWLGQILWYGAYLVGEWRGIVALRAIAVALLVALIAAAAIARRPGRPLLAIVVAIPAVLLSRFVWAERPELFGFVCFAAAVLLFDLGSGGRGLPSTDPARRAADRALVGLAPLLVVWANLHGSFALGSVLALLIAGEGWLRDPACRRPYAILGGGALLSFVITPAGLATLASPRLHLFEPPRDIQEWGVPDPTALPGMLWALELVLVLATAMLCAPALHRGSAPSTPADRRGFTPSTPSMHLREAIVLIPVLALSLAALRHMPLFAIAATPYIAARLPEAWRAIATGISLPIALPRLADVVPPPHRIGAAVAAVALAAILGGAAVAPPAPDDAGYPLAALPVLPSGPGLLARYEWGGWLIWSAPSTPVFVDGRLVPYRGAVLDDYARVIDALPGWREVLIRRGVRALLLHPADAAAVRAKELGWPVLASGNAFVLIQVRER